MISVLATIVVVLGTFGALSYEALVAWKSYEVSSLLQRDVARVSEMAVVARPALWVDPTGVPRAPLGVLGSDGRQHLPPSVVGDDSTPWGTRVAWCPVALQPPPGSQPPAGTAASVPDAAGRPSYAVATTQGAQLGSSPAAYVVSSTAGPPSGPAPYGVVGYLLSPAPYGLAAPACADVVWRGASPVVSPTSGSPGGFAVAVDARGTTLSAAAELTASASDLRVDVAPSTLGDGGGEDPADAMALPDALALWAQVQPRSTVFVMAAGTYPLPAGITSVDAGAPWRAVRLLSPTPGAATLSAPSGAAELAIAGDAVVDGLASSSGVVVAAATGGRLSVIRSSLQEVDAMGGSVVVDGTDSVSLLRTVAGSARVSGGSGVSSVEVDDGDLALDGAAVAAAPANVVVAGTGRVSLLDGATLGGSSSLLVPATASCGSPGGDGTTSCAATCDRVHPRLRLPSCGGDGVTLASLSTTTALTGDAVSCSFRPWGPLVERKVLSGDGSGSVTTAVDLDPGAAAPNPLAAATCSMNP